MTGGSARYNAQVQGTGLYYSPPGATSTNNVRFGQICPGQSLGYGTGFGNANLHCQLSIVLLSGQSQSINLYDGSVVELSGQPAPFRTLRAISVWISGGGDNSGVSLQAGGVNGLTPPGWSTGAVATMYPGAGPVGGGSQVGVTVSASANILTLTTLGAATATVIVTMSGSNGA